MPHKYLLLFGALLFMGLGEAVQTVAASTPIAIGPYAKRKPIKAQHKHKKAPHHKNRPLVRTT